MRRGGELPHLPAGLGDENLSEDLGEARMFSNRSRAGRKGVINSSIRSESSSMSLVCPSIRSRNRRVINA